MKRILAASAALAVAATGMIGVTTSQAATTKTLKYGIVSTFKSLEVRSSQWGNSSAVYQAPYDTLVTLKPDGTMVPNLALSWKSDAMGTGITLKLRPNVKFTDGEPFNASAVCANLKAFQKGDTPEASNAASMQSCKATGPLTVLITLKDVDPAFTNYFTRSMGMMQAPKTIGTAAAKTNPVGTGPYVIDKKRTVVDSAYYFTKNPNYWNKSVPRFDTVVFKILTDATAAVMALRTGEVDVVNVSDRSAIGSLKSAGLKFAEQQLDWQGLILVDRDGKMGSPLGNVKVRQALNYAFDRPAVLKIVGDGFGKVTDQVFPSYSKAYDKALENRYPYNPAKAKALLAEAGYPNGFEIATSMLTAYDKGISAQVTVNALAAIGITVKAQDLPMGDFVTAILTPKFPMFWMQLERSPNDWQHINFTMSRDAVFNPSHYGDATSDGLLAKIQTSTGAAQVKYLKAFNKYITDQAWFVPWFANTVETAYNPKTVKVLVQPGNVIPYLPYGVLPAKG